ncbi:hypothetical protein OE88DRAFT_1739222 [Heliocybe sulcata]|uniref:F-box domain-containing protein n=1 Tax=Heliocybe sulcata TaxID=5364 RepID=A0A5C3MS61_9AGAM|nr:hypothetical protein OE88DRAFT_1739222 [Heliocybe sulcata]
MSQPTIHRGLDQGLRSTSNAPLCSQSAALIIPADAQRTICRDIRGSSDDWQNDMYHLALTCKAYNTTALDALWERLYSIWPLFRLMYSFKLRTNVKTGQVWARAPMEYNEADWRRFAKYAPRVRLLTHREDSAVPVLALIRAIKAHTTDHTFISNLRRLTWHLGPTNQEDSLLSLREFTLRHLQSLEINWPEHLPDGIPSIVRGLPGSAPQLRRLRLGSLISFTIEDRFLEPLAQLQHLETLELKVLDDSQFEELYTSVRSLKRLSIGYCDTHWHQIQVDGIHPRLEELILGGFFAREATPVIAHLGSTSLRRLTKLSKCEIASLLEIWQLCNELSPRFASTLTNVRITMDTLAASEGLSPDPPQLMDALYPLLELPELRVFELAVHQELRSFVPELHDKDMHLMLVAWPRIERLSLLVQFVGLTTGSLVEVAHHCEELEDLRLWRISIPPDVAVPEGFFTSLPSLCVLHVRDYEAPPSAWGAYARFLRTLFPNLEVPDDVEDILPTKNRRCTSPGTDSEDDEEEEACTSDSSESDGPLDVSDIASVSDREERFMRDVRRDMGE